MRKTSLFNVVFVLALLLIGVGFYRGWFTLSSHRDGVGGNQVDVNLKVDPDKAKADAEAVKAKARDLAGSARDGSSQTPADDELKSKNN